MRISPTALSALLLAGCAAQGVKNEPDTTPTAPTAVTEILVASGGFKGIAPIEATDRTWTRPDRQRIERTFKGTGTFTKYLLGSSAETRIDRVDSKLAWTLDPKAKTYTECPLKGCPPPPAPPQKEEKPADKPPQQAGKPAEPECKVKIAKAAFAVTPANRKQTINGFESELYQVRWDVTLQDPQARTTLSTVAVEVWTTFNTAALRDASDLEKVYARNYAAAVAKAQAGEAKKPVVPPEAQAIIENYMNQLLAGADRAAFLRAGKELERIKGNPILTELTWDLKGDACARPEGAQPVQSSGSSSSGSVISQVSDWFVRKQGDAAAKDMAGKPLLSFRVETRLRRVEPVHDSVFNIPRGYKLAPPR
jgi:hypothetical protein